MTETTFSTLVDAATAIKERDEHIVRLTAERDNWKAKAEETLASLAIATDQRIIAMRSLENFRDSVRDAAIRTQENHSHHISVSALNEWLDDLGLDPVEQEWEVEVSVTRKWTGTVTVTATSKDAAGDAVVVEFENDDFQVDRHLEEDTSYFEVEVESVSSTS